MKAAVAGILFQQNLDNKYNIDKTETDTDTSIDSDWSDLSDMDTSTNVATNKKIARNQRNQRAQYVDDDDILTLNRIFINIISAAAFAIIIMVTIIYVINYLCKLFM